MGLEKQGSKPTGKIGYFIGKLMNRFHTAFYKKYYDSILPKGSVTFLDLGCGGGRLIAHLYDRAPTYRLFGLDHSQEMIALSEQVNQEGIERGHVTFDCSSVSHLPYDQNSMQIVTANETVQFWPDIPTAFAEVYRVLKQEGSFFIINRYPPEGSKWWKLAKLKNAADYQRALEAAGFKSIETDLTTKKGWIVSRAIKSSV